MIKAIINLLEGYVGRLNYISRTSEIGDRYYLYNGYEDVVLLVTEDGEINNSYDYDIFGNPTLTVEEEKSEIRYAGEYFDESIGLYYLRERYYNLYPGRFVSEDSYWGEDVNPESLNLYTYCHNDSINFINPTGHKLTYNGFYKEESSSKSKEDIIKEIDKQKEIWNKENEGRSYSERSSCLRNHT